MMFWAHLHYTSKYVDPVVKHFPIKNNAKVKSELITMADIEFPKRGGGGAPASKVGAPKYYFANFPENCMKMKKNLTRGGGEARS